MFNCAVIRLKDVIKCLLTLIIIVVVIYGVNRYFFYNEKFQFDKIDIWKKIENKISKYVLYPIKSEMPVTGKILEANNKEIEQSNNIIDENIDNADEEFMKEIFTSMLGMELPVINSKIEDNKKVAEVQEQEEKKEKEQEENTEKDEEKKEEKKEEKIDNVQTDVKTEVVTEKPLADKFTDTYNNVKIKNETSFELTNDVLDTSKLDIKSSNVIIFHTHTCESYTPSEKYTYKATGNFRTTDLNYSVARVGDELTKYLTDYGFNTVHDKTYHDYPAYNGSYSRSLETVSNVLKSTSADIIIDLHRDAIGSYSSYAPTVKIGDDYCAQIMFVMGSNGGGLYHPNWQNNLKFAVKMQDVSNSLYPGLFKPIILRNSRYNQHLGKAACIIEVGSTGNTLEQCLNSMKYFSKVMETAFK